MRIKIIGHMAQLFYALAQGDTVLSNFFHPMEQWGAG
jgi:hypothetical protein